MSATAIQQAITVAGSQAKLAKLIGVTQGLVSLWARGATIPTRHFAAIERSTGITAQALLIDELSKHGDADALPCEPGASTPADQEGI